MYLLNNNSLASRQPWSKLRACSCKADADIYLIFPELPALHCMILDASVDARDVQVGNCGFVRSEQRLPRPSQRQKPSASDNRCLRSKQHGLLSLSPLCVSGMTGEAAAGAGTIKSA